MTRIESDSTNKCKYLGNVPKINLSILLAVLLLIIFRTTVSAQVVINELGVLDSPDWIEIYNFDQQPVDLSVFKVKDDKGNELTLSGILAGGGFKSFDWSNRLNNAGDVVWLVKVSDDSVIEELKYGEKGGVCVPSNESGSIGKLTDGASGSERLERFSKDSKGSSNNNGVIDPCPTPTPEPTDSPTPTTKPTNTPIPKPTSTSVPTSKPKATTTFTVVPTIKQEDGQETGEGQTLKLGGDTTNEVLGIKDVGEKESETANEEADKKFPFLALIPIILGVTLMGSSFYYFLRKRKKDYNSDGE